MPVSKDDLLRDLLNTFQTEAAEHIQALNSSLLQLERSPDAKKRRKLLQDAFRAAHSLKGGARVVNLKNIEGLAHAAESILQQARDAKLELDAEICDALYDMLDTITSLLAGENVDINPLQARLLGIAGGEVPDTIPQPEAGVAAMPGMHGETIRVSVDKLDDLMAQVGELLVAKISAGQRQQDFQALRNELTLWPKVWREVKTLLPRVDGKTGLRLSELLNEHSDHMQTFSQVVNDFDLSIKLDTTRLNMVTAGLQDKVRHMRMVPFQTLALVLERSVRDAAHGEGKQANFGIMGGDVELDKKVLETLKDPLLHLLRNAVSHGIEAPEERTAAGKSDTGNVAVAVQQRGSEVRIVVSDDGRGFDIEALRHAIINSNGSPLSDNASDDEIIAQSFLPGVTTAQELTTLSGRGIGLDVVRQSLETIQGRSVVHNIPRQGVAIELRVPTSLAMTRGLLVRVGTERYVLPLLSIEKIEDTIDTFIVSGKHMLMAGDIPLPVVPLADALERPATNGKTAQNPAAVIIGVAEQRLALLVDEVLTEQELAVKPLGNPLQRVRNVTGAALTGTGEPVIILNVADLVKSARGVRTVVSTAPDAAEEEVPPVKVLVVDDSITTRTLEKHILEKAGYIVTIATDGTEALPKLHENVFDIVIADVQMPQMDGFTLTQRIRESEDHSTMPIILVTSLESREDREKGLLAGADAYITKRGFDQSELLDTIQRLL